MKNNKYTLYKAINYIKLLYNRSSMQSNLIELQNYHLGIEDFNFTKVKESLLNQILEYSREYCPYYRELYKECNIEVLNSNSFKSIPFLDKKTIKENYNSLQSKELKRVTNYIMNTGGTTGTPLTFPVSSHFEYEHHEFAFKLFNYKKGDEIVSFSGSALTEEKIKKNIYWWKASKTTLPYGKIRLSSLYLNNQTAVMYIDELNRIKPSFIRGYPSAMNYLAIYMLDKGIQFDFELKGAFLTAENIFQNQISNIKSAFKCPVSLEYGHSEVSVFAYTIDDSYEYYCSPFYGYTEVVTPNGETVNIGDVGEVVVTGFYNKSMPFIRYKTGDLAIYNGDKDGVTRLKRIDGRTQDYLLNKNGDKVYVVGLIYGGHHSFLNNVKKWQIIQNEPGFIEIDIIKGKEFSSKDERDIIELFMDKENIKAEIKFVNEINLTSRGKNKLIVQNIII